MNSLLDNRWDLDAVDGIIFDEGLRIRSVEAQLKNLTISRTGIHWPELDEDLSLRGFLKEEMLNAIKKDISLTA